MIIYPGSYSFNVLIWRQDFLSDAGRVVVAARLNSMDGLCHDIDSHTAPDCNTPVCSLTCL